MRKVTEKRAVPATRRSIEPRPKERFEILVEELKSEFRAVAEGHGMLNRKIDDLRGEMNQEIGGLRGDMNEGFAGVNARIDSVAKDLGEHRADTEVHSQKYKVSEGEGARYPTTEKGCG